MLKLDNKIEIRYFFTFNLRLNFYCYKKLNRTLTFGTV